MAAAPPIPVGPGMATKQMAGCFPRVVSRENSGNEEPQNTTGRNVQGFSRQQRWVESAAPLGVEWGPAATSTVPAIATSNPFRQSLSKRLKNCRIREMNACPTSQPTAVDDCSRPFRAQTLRQTFSAGSTAPNGATSRAGLRSLTLLTAFSQYARKDRHQCDGHSPRRQAGKNARNPRLGTGAQLVRTSVGLRSIAVEVCAARRHAPLTQNGARAWATRRGSRIPRRAGRGAVMRSMAKHTSAGDRHAWRKSNVPSVAPTRQFLSAITPVAAAARPPVGTLPVQQ